jgi:hypothetical protein
LLQKQNEIAETVFDVVNQDADKTEQKKRAKRARISDDKDSDVIIHGFVKKLGGLFVFPKNYIFVNLINFLQFLGPFTSAWQTK